jgi:ATP-dependent DNA ligase
VVDGEIVALDGTGRPTFNLLQHSRSQASRICYFIFDLLVYGNRDLTQLPLIERREILNSALKLQSPKIRITQYVETSAETMLRSARKQGLEGVVAKRKDSRYEAGKRSGVWAKFRLNSGQELVIGGYVPGAHGIESIIVGYCRESQLIYVARVRNGFVPGDTSASARETASASGAHLPLREPFLKCTRAAVATGNPTTRTGLRLEENRDGPTGSDSARFIHDCTPHNSPK